MLGFGQVLEDDEIASLLSYVRGQWGKIDEPIKGESVKRIRRATSDRIGYWSVDDLLRIP